MLRELSIENVAVIAKATVNFEKGFNIMTGETGAGKSILIDSINAIMGNRVSREIIRTGAEKASIFAVFDDVPESVTKALNEAGYEYDGGDLIIQREISLDGRNRCRINGAPATAGAIRELCSSLITIHGQHDNMDLLDPEKHLDILDSFGDLDEIKTRYAGLYNEYTDLQRKLSELSLDEAYKARRIDLLTYQINEIEQAQLTEGEEDELSEQRNILRNSEKLMSSLQNANMLISASDDSPTALELLSEASRSLDSISNISADFETLAGKVSDLYYELDAAASDIQDQIDSIDVDGQDLQYIEDRLDLIYRLKKKYGSSVSEILEFCENAKQELETIEGSDEEIARITKILEKKKIILTDCAEELSEERRKTFNSMSGRIVDELRFLNMTNSVFELSSRRTDLGPRGIDEIEFLLSTNKGEEPKPLSKIASGGELSRIMLGIKNVLAEKDHIGTLIFDEIDSGVSGSGAQKIGLKLRQTAATHQIICVTHSAQIASFCDNHLLVEKETRGEKTFTDVRRLDRNDRIKEIARIISGDAVTEIALQNAREMVEIAERSEIQ